MFINWMWTNENWLVWVYYRLQPVGSQTGSGMHPGDMTDRISARIIARYWWTIWVSARDCRIDLISVFELDKRLTPRA